MSQNNRNHCRNIQNGITGEIHDQLSTRKQKNNTILLKQYNHASWSIAVGFLIESRGWDQILRNPWHDGFDGTKTFKEAFENDLALSAEKQNEITARLRCSTFILKHIDPIYWGLFDTEQGDPYVMWKDIEQVWNSEDLQPRITRHLLTHDLEWMSLGDQSIFTYMGRARATYAELLSAGGSMSTQELIDCIMKGLPWPKYRAAKEAFHSGWLDILGVEAIGSGKSMTEQLRELQEFLEVYDEKAREGEEEAARIKTKVKELVETRHEVEAKKPHDKEQSDSDESFNIGGSPSISLYFDSP